MNGNGAQEQINTLIALQELQSTPPVSTSAAGHIYPQPEKEKIGSFLKDVFKFATSVGVDTGEFDWGKLPIYLVGLGLTAGGGGGSRKVPSRILKSKGPSSIKPPAASAMFSEGLKSKGLMPLGKSDLTKAIAWDNYPKSWTEGSSRGIKAYHGTPYKLIGSDLKAGVHIGSPGAAIDRLADKITWSDEYGGRVYGDVTSGFVHGVELYPKKPFTRLSPDFEDVVRDVIGHHEAFLDGVVKKLGVRTDVEDYLDEIRGFKKMTEADPVRHEFPAILDELGDNFDANIEKEFLSLLDRPEYRKKLTDLGYDVVPYMNAFEGMGSVSFNVINPKKARLNLIDEIYTVERPFRRSSDIKPSSIEAILDPRNEIRTLEDLISATRIGTMGKPIK